MTKIRLVLSEQLAKIGINIEIAVSVVIILGGLIFFAVDYRKGLVFWFVANVVAFLLFFVGDGYNYVYSLVLMVISLILMSFSLFLSARQNRGLVA